MVRLTPRERSVVKLNCQGLSSKEIAGALSLATGTVDQYLKFLAVGVGVTGRRQLTIWAYQNPRCFLEETWSERGLHPQGCGCDSIYCTSMRVANSQEALEEYKRQRDAKRAEPEEPELVKV